MDCMCSLMGYTDRCQPLSNSLTPTDLQLFDNTYTNKKYQAHADEGHRYTYIVDKVLSKPLKA